MSFDWGLYLQLAGALQAMGEQGGPGEEAAFRACVSRAYYALYNQALDKYIEVFRMDPFGRDSSGHKSLIRSYEAKEGHLSPQSRNKAVRVISQSLDRAREYRNNADYDRVLPRSAKRLAAATMLYVNDAVAELPNIAPDTKP